jgi:hypothetical protein
MDQPSFAEWIAMNVAVTYELRGLNAPSKEVIKVIISELQKYKQPQLEKAFTDLRMGKGTLSFGEIISAIDDGRPTALEAWAMANKSEYESYCSNNEIDEAMEVANSLIASGERFNSSKAFIQKYDKVVADHKQKGIEPVYYMSYGWDKTQHREAELFAETKGWIAPKSKPDQKQIEGTVTKMPQEIKQKLKDFSEGKKMDKIGRVSKQVAVEDNWGL